MVAYSFKRRFVAPIRAGLGLIMMGKDHEGKEVPCELVLDDGETKPRPFDPELDLDPPITPKRQTIRAGRLRHARPGETIQLYCGMRTKQCFKIGDARCIRVRSITMAVCSNVIHWIRIEGVPLVGTLLQDFARADGFANAEEMKTFWLTNHFSTTFSGVLIEWEPLP